MTTTSYRNVSKLAIVVSLICASASNASAASIQPGFDLFHTPDSFPVTADGPTRAPFLFSLLGSTNKLTSNPIGPGSADTIILRKQGIDFGINNPGMVEIEMVALSLKSTAPVYVPQLGRDADVYVVVNRLIEDMTANGNHDGVPNGQESTRWASDLIAHSRDLPTPTPISTSTMEIKQDNDTGGTLTMTRDFLVHADIYADDPLHGIFLGTDTVDQTGHGLWTFAPPGSLNNAEFPSGNFYLDVAHFVHVGPHPLPIPASLWLFGSAFVGFLANRRKRTGMAA